jgi:hypothetical protein
MDFNLSAKGRPEKVLDEIASQAKAKAKDVDKATAQCVDAVFQSLSKYVEGVCEDAGAIAVSATIKIYEL